MKSIYYIAVPLVLLSAAAGTAILEQTAPAVDAGKIIYVQNERVKKAGKTLPVFVTRADHFKKQFGLFRKKHGSAAALVLN